MCSNFSTLPDYSAARPTVNQRTIAGGLAAAVDNRKAAGGINKLSCGEPPCPSAYYERGGWLGTLHEA